MLSLSKVPHCLHRFLCSISIAPLKIKRHYLASNSAALFHFLGPIIWQYDSICRKVVGRKDRSLPSKDTKQAQSSLLYLQETKYSGCCNILKTKTLQLTSILRAILISFDTWEWSGLFLAESLNSPQSGCERKLSAEWLFTVCVVVLLAEALL